MAQIGQVFGVAVLGLPVYAHLLQGNAGQQPDPSHPLPFIDGLRRVLWVSGSCFTGQPRCTQRVVPRRLVDRVSHDRPPIELEGDQHRSVRRHV